MEKNQEVGLNSKIYTFFEDILDWTHSIGSQIEINKHDIECVTGIPRGGIIPAVILSHTLNKPYIPLTQIIEFNYDLYPNGVEPKKVLLVDDISDSGHTFKKYSLHGFLTAALIVREGTEFIPDIYAKTIHGKAWIVFPWENNNSKNIQDYLTTE